MNRFRDLLKNGRLWIVVLTAVLGGVFSFDSQLTDLYQFPVQRDAQVAIFTAVYRLCFLFSAMMSAWCFGFKGGLAVCLLVGSAVFVSTLPNLRFPQSLVDFFVILLGFLFVWLAGTQGKLKKRLLATTARLEAEITERKQAEKELEQAADQWGATFDAISDWICILDKDHKLVRVNKAFAAACGKKPEELIGRKCYEFIHNSGEPAHGCPLQKMINKRVPVTAEIYEEGLGVYLEVTTSPLFGENGEVAGAVHVARDVTERRKVQDQLMLADRLASLGEMASGIAHELNNPLTSIITFSHLLMEKEINADIRDDVVTINKEARRTAEIIKNLLTFARKHPPVKQRLRIQDVIDEVLKLRHYHQTIQNIEVVRRYSPDVPDVLVDYFQMQQVFFNIIINAEYFMTRTNNRGMLTISIEKLQDAVRIAFADDGPGIHKEDLPKLFSPFYTTKEVGKGTGLGLSVCHGIVAEHKGRLYARSQVGKGSTFTVELPLNGTK